MTEVAVNYNIRSAKRRAKVTLNNITTETPLIAAGGAGIVNDIYALILANTGAAATVVTLRDGVAGVIVGVFPVAIGQTLQIGVEASSGIPQAAANIAWTLQCSVATVSLEATALYIAQPIPAA